LAVARGAPALGCGKPRLEGTWSQIDPKTGIEMGNVLTVKGDAWHVTGFPDMDGSIEWKDGKLFLKVEKVAGEDRAAAIKSAGTQVDMEANLKRLDEQMLFDVVTEDGKQVLKQAGPNAIWSEMRFRKVGD
jgi:hypothetical protein